MGQVETQIQKKISALNPQFSEVVNESHNHSVPKNSETHFRLVLVSEKFEGQSRVQRQRLIYDLLSDELKSGVHALTMRLLTPSEFAKEDPSKFQSPACHGGSKS